METEIIVIAYSCYKLFPIMDGFSIICKAIGFPAGNSTIQVLIHNYNAVALVLGKTLPSQSTAQSKHSNTKTISFQDKILKYGIKLLKITTTEQLEDSITKGLTKPGNDHLRKKLMGWQLSAALMLDRECPWSFWILIVLLNMSKQREYRQ